MTDTMTVREACEHGLYVAHPMTQKGATDRFKDFVITTCPGGKEIRLRAVPMVRMGGIDPAWYRAKDGDEPDETVWLMEVSDG